MGRNHRAVPWHGMARDEICWWPIVQSCQCDGCGLCVTSCPVEALSFDCEAGIPFIRDAHRCVVGCSTCATLCPNEAILLPGRAAIQQTIAQGSLADRARKELRAYRKRYGGRMPQPTYPGDLDERQRAN